MLHIITLLVLSAIPAHATCAALGSNVWHCPDTGNPTTNGTDLASFFHSKPFACGDRIILYAGVVYRGLEAPAQDPLNRLHNQTGCAGKLTSTESSRLSEIPPNQKERLANYRAYMPTIEVGTNAAFQFEADAGGGSNNYAFRGIRITPSAYTVANRYRMATLGFATGGFLWTSANLALYSPHDFEFDRVIMEDYEEAVYGDPNTSNTNGNAFLRSVSLGIKGPFQNMYVHDSFFKFDGYSNTGGLAGTTDWITISTVTATNPAVIQGTTLTTQLGITYDAGCGVCGGIEDPAPCTTACKRVVIRGGTGAWAAFNGPRAVRARADGDVDVFTPNPNYTSGHTAFDASGLGAFAATSPQLSAIAPLVQYAIVGEETAANWRIIDNFLEAWAMPIFLGGADGPPIDPAVIQSGSTPTSLVLNHVRNLRVGMAVAFAVPAGSGASDYCVLGNPGSGCYATDIFRVGRVTVIAGNTVTLEPWGVDGTDGITPETGGQAIWDTWTIRGIQVRGNAISRGYLHSNASVGKGVLQLKKCSNCLFDGNAMGGYMDASNVMRGNVGGTFFAEAVTQGGKEPNSLVNTVRFSNNLGAGQLGGGSAACLWGNAAILNYVHFHSAVTSEKLFYEHNVAVGCQATANPQQTHIQMLSALNSHYKHNTFAPDMAQTYDYRFAYNSDCVPTGAEAFPFFPEIGRSYNAGVKDNIIGYGAGAYLGLPNAATCWPTIAADIQKNIIVDTESAGTGTINTAHPNNFPVANYTSFWAGTCAYDSWTNCSLASGNPNRGAASDGGDPGADILQVQDRIYRWSERAGLIESDMPASPQMRLRTGNWAIGSTAASVRFQIYNSIASSGCTVELFTNRNRATAHADAPSAQFCNRTTSVVSGNNVSYTFGVGFALTANTEYFYKITDGSRVMVGEFRTLPAGSGAAVSTCRYSSARTGNLCTDAAMTTGCSAISSAATHAVSVPQGAIRFYQSSGGAVIPMVAR